MKEEWLNKSTRSAFVEEKKTPGKDFNMIQVELETSPLKKSEELKNELPKRKKTAFVPKKSDKYEMLDENLNPLSDFVFIENFFQQKGNELNLAIVILRPINYENISKNPEQSKKIKIFYGSISFSLKLLIYRKKDKRRLRSRMIPY